MWSLIFNIKGILIFIHSFIQYLLGIFYIPGTVTGTGVTTINKTLKKHVAYILVGEENNYQNKI